MIIIFLVIFLIISLFMYLIIVGGNLNKSEYEKQLEMNEQSKYILDYDKRMEDKKINGRKSFYRKKK